MRRLVASGALGAALWVGLAPAGAQESDPRLVTRAYNATQIVKIYGRPGVQATIAFADDEKIENVAVGDSNKWQITPNKRANLLFARPLDPAAATNMTVVTDKRTYLFDLVASAKDRPVYMLRFTYSDMAPAPAPIAAPEAAPPPVLARAPQETLTPPRLVEPQDPRPTLTEPPLPMLPEPEAPAMAQAQQAVSPMPPEPRPLQTAQAARSAPQPIAVPQELPPVAQPLAYRSSIDEAVGAPAEVLPAGQSAHRAEANRPGDPAPVSLKPAKREKQAKSAPSPKPRPPSPAVRVAVTPAMPAVPVASFPTEPGALNFAWQRGGKTELLPMRVYDDGRATYLVWGTRQSVPEVQVIGAQGEQVSPGMTRQDNYVVIPSVPSRIVLRSANASATLDNLRQARAATALARPLTPGASE